LAFSTKTGAFIAFTTLACIILQTKRVVERARICGSY
jgi:hypothetical protein